MRLGVRATVGLSETSPIAFKGLGWWCGIGAVRFQSGTTPGAGAGGGASPATSCTAFRPQTRGPVFGRRPQPNIPAQTATPSPPPQNQTPTTPTTSPRPNSQGTPQSQPSQQQQQRQQQPQHHSNPRWNASQAGSSPHHRAQIPTQSHSTTTSNVGPHSSRDGAPRGTGNGRGGEFNAQSNRPSRSMETGQDQRAGVGSGPGARPITKAEGSGSGGPTPSPKGGPPPTSRPHLPQTAESAPFSDWELDDAATSASTREMDSPMDVEGRPSSTTTTSSFISKAFGSQPKPSSDKPKGLDRTTATGTPIVSAASSSSGLSSTERPPSPTEKDELEPELGLSMLDEASLVEKGPRRSGVDRMWSEGGGGNSAASNSDNLLDTDLDSEDFTDSLGNGGDDREPSLAFKSAANGENEDRTVLNAENAVVGGSLNSTNRSSFEGKQKLSS